MFKKQFVAMMLLFCTSKVQSTVLDFRIAGLVPSSTLFRHIYGSINPSYQIEVSGPIKDCFTAWANLSYFNSSGKSIPLHFKSSLQLVPVSAGVKYVHAIRDVVNIYTGAGLCYTWLKEKQHCRLLNKAHHVGGIIKLGITKEHRCMNFSLFADYQIQRFDVKNAEHCKKVNAGGFLFGGALGVFF